MLSNHGDTIEGVTLRQNLVNVVLADGPIKDINHVYCKIAGNLTIEWQDGTTEIVAFIVGEAHPVEGAKTDTATTGTFHFSRD